MQIYLKQIIKKTYGLKPGFFAVPKKQKLTKFQKSQDQEKNTQKNIHQDESPISEEKPKKQTKNIMLLEKSRFSSYNIKQAIFADQSGTEPPGRGQKVKERQLEVNGKTLTCRGNRIEIHSLRKEPQAFLNISKDQRSQFHNQQQKQKEMINKLEKIEENQYKLQRQMKLKEQGINQIMTEGEKNQIFQPK